MSDPLICEPGGSGLILPLFPGENTWDPSRRAWMYGGMLLWSFLGVAIVADCFMGAIERITSQEKKVSVKVREAPKTYFVRIWNPTVANLTLMALGSSAPEILLSVIELLGNKMYAGDLGPSTIVGSAAFNLLVIIALCVVAVPDGEVRRIDSLGVYACTAVASVGAYVWLVVILQLSSPDLIEVWEGVVTFVAFPALVWISYLLDIGYFNRAQRKDREIIMMASAHVMGAGGDDGGGGGGGSGLHPALVAKLVKMVREDVGGDLTPERLSELVGLKLQMLMPRTRAYYRIASTRSLMSGGAKLETGGAGGAAAPARAYAELVGSDALGDGRKYARVADDEVEAAKLDEKVRLEREKKSAAAVGFSSAVYRVMEHCGHARLSVVRSGNVHCKLTVKWKTRDMSAVAGQDYVAASGSLEFGVGEEKKDIAVRIVDDNVYEPDESFAVDLSDAASDFYASPAKLGAVSSAQVTIIDDDFPGVLNFAKPELTVCESAGEAVLRVERVGGCSGTVGCSYETIDGEAVAGHDYVGASGRLTFLEGEAVREVRVPIIDDSAYEKDERFRVRLFDPSGGATFGYDFEHKPLKLATCEVTITSDDQAAKTVDLVSTLVASPINRHAFEFGASSYKAQFAAALDPNGGDADAPPPTPLDWVLHVLSLPWKLVFAIIPPSDLGGGLPAFGVSLLFIGLVTAVIGDIASLFGCVLGLPDAVTAITFVAMGTSLPDTFASMAAARNDPSADASIVNVTGSNAVNVFLGLGLPWMIGAIYWARAGPTAEWLGRYADAGYASAYPAGGFVVPAGDLVFSVSMFVSCALACFAVLSARRYFCGHELGGHKLSKMLTAAFFATLWVVYIVASVAKSL